MIKVEEQVSDYRDRIFIPMKDSKKWIKQRNDYLKSLDKKYGVGLSIRNWRDRDED